MVHVLKAHKLGKKLTKDVESVIGSIYRLNSANAIGYKFTQNSNGTGINRGEYLYNSELYHILNGGDEDHNGDILVLFEDTYGFSSGVYRIWRSDTKEARKNFGIKRYCKGCLCDVTDTMVCTCAERPIGIESTYSETEVLSIKEAEDERRKSI